ncbi:hypothetical protein SY86_24605 [Erwinia tracheiphila]|uniref:Uncharacterized protein n=1 Tax=Erwinia tracheiphila TaxID=65700 RepID=A0A0M2K478_9GAMM|nr:hypothetical protein ETR_14641 [Erwinia tracheiphila PSU-1]KKF34200.1 hypothetical protein SY86_24605 [Erwinia tracheiphila]
MFPDSGLSATFRHLFASGPVAMMIQLIHFVLCQFQYGTEAFFINDLPLINTIKFVEDLISQRAI